MKSALNPIESPCFLLKSHSITIHSPFFTVKTTSVTPQLPPQLLQESDQLAGDPKASLRQKGHDPSPALPGAGRAADAVGVVTDAVGEIEQKHRQGPGRNGETSNESLANGWLKIRTDAMDDLGGLLFQETI